MHTKKELATKLRVLWVTNLFYRGKWRTLVTKGTEEIKASEETPLYISFNYVKPAKILCPTGICVEVYIIVLIHKLQSKYSRITLSWMAYNLPQGPICLFYLSLFFCFFSFSYIRFFHHIWQSFVYNYIFNFYG